MKILSIVGARPQFVKAAVLVRAFEHHSRTSHQEIEHSLMHTGQHYGAGLSEVFFQQLRLPLPDTSLGIGSGKHGMQTASMLASIEASLETRRPDIVIVYGDTNSTLAGALAAAKLHIPLVHLEAGLRSFDRHMPEELNRIVSDHISNLLLCPTQTAMDNLSREGITEASVWVGDVMLDAVLMYSGSADDCPIRQLGLSKKRFVLVTLHRAANTDNPERLRDFVALLERMPVDVVLPMHPRLQKCLGSQIRLLLQLPHVHLIPPVGYFQMLALERDSEVVLTDSGGVQKEAYFLGVPCITLREETEWVETLQGGWNQLMGMDRSFVLPALKRMLDDDGACPTSERDLRGFGDGRAGEMCVKAILNFETGKK